MGGWETCRLALGPPVSSDGSLGRSQGEDEEGRWVGGWVGRWVGGWVDGWVGYLPSCPSTSCFIRRIIRKVSRRRRSSCSLLAPVASHL